VSLIVRNLSKSYKQGKFLLPILNNIDLDINEGEIVSLVGPSGSGKTTLLQVLGLIDTVDSGSILFENVECSKLTEDKLTKLRQNKIGYVYQFHYLLPEFNAIENVMMPLLIQGRSKTEAYKAALSILTDLGLVDRINNIPTELSGGEQQRVAIARALVHKPKLLLADEPTGNLDNKNAELVIDLMLNEVRLRKISVIIVTHNFEIAKKTDRILIIKDQKIYNYSDVTK
jgi:lipoprotein-releasing system ATP-binding protein